MKKPAIAKRLLLASVILFGVGIVAFICIRRDTQPMGVRTIDPENVTIVRDQWGVPHIFGKTDADVAYGLAWANAEDSFALMQELMLIAKGMYARYKGSDGAAYDFALQALRIPDLVEQRYESDLSPAFRDYLDGYAQGINDYARKHPKQILVKELFPLTGKDIIQGYCFLLAAETGAEETITRILDGSIEEPQAAQALDGGSNGIALRAHRSAKGETLLLINPHQPFEGVGSIYEAHLVSEEGLNIHGGLWQGSVGVQTGVNEHLGWMSTTNGLDKIDVFRLEMHPTQENLYRFDGDWIELEKWVVKVKVKVFWFIHWTFKRDAYWSKYGATFKTENGVYAIRMPITMRITAAEQYHRMAKATSLDEFLAAFELQGIPHENFIYADRDDNILLLNNGLIPKRNPAYDWDKVVPGNTSETLWTGFHPLEDLVQYLNPECGYLYNTNNSPFFATCPEGNQSPTAFPAYYGFWMGQNNRGRRVEAWMAQNPKPITYEAFKALKYDRRLPDNSPSLAFLREIQQLDTSEHPELTEIVAILRTWDLDTGPESFGASIFHLLSYHILIEKGGDSAMLRSMEPITFDQAYYVKALTYAKDYLERHFGTVHVQLGQLLRHRRGGKDLPTGGYPDVLGMTQAIPDKDGMFKAVVGDGFVMFARFSAQGVEIETANAYGASQNPDNPHYTDQMELNVGQHTKHMTLDNKTVLENGIRVYHPGQSQ
jgi:acyl-homoserine-lactone acylase